MKFLYPRTGENYLRFLFPSSFDTQDIMHVNIANDNIEKEAHRLSKISIFNKFSFQNAFSKTIHFE